MKKILLLFFCASMFAVNAYSHVLEGEWKNGSYIAQFKKYENNPTKLKVVVYPKNSTAEACSYIETNCVLRAESEKYKSYVMTAHKISSGGTQPYEIKVRYVVDADGRVDVLSLCGETPIYDDRTKIILTKQKSSGSSMQSQQTASNQNRAQTPQSSYQQTQAPRQRQETKIPNIRATYGSKSGVWFFEFTTYGTFRDHNCELNDYGKIRKEKGVLSGTYYLTEDERGTTRVYLRYENGKKKEGWISYYSKYSEFHIDMKLYREM